MDFVSNWLGFILVINYGVVLAVVIVYNVYMINIDDIARWLRKTGMMIVTQRGETSCARCCSTCVGC